VGYKVTGGHTFKSVRDAEKSGALKLAQTEKRVHN